MSDRILSTSNLIKVLGLRKSYPTIITSSALVLVSFFYVFTISSYFKVNTFILENRVTYVDTFDKYVISQYLDHILIVAGAVIWFLSAIRGNRKFYISSVYGGLALVGVLFGLDIIIDVLSLSSLPVVILLVVYNKLAHKKKILCARSNLTLNYLAILGSITGSVGIVLSLESVLSIPLSSHVRNYAYDVFVLFSTFSPVLMFLVIFCFPVKLITIELKNRIRKSKNKKNNDNRTIASGFFPGYATVKLRSKVIYLTIFILLSIVLVLIPHYPTINRNNQQIGVDTKYYIDWLDPLMRSNNTQEYIHQAFVIQGHNGDRPITLILLFALVKLIGTDNASHVIEHVPLILGPALVLVIYFLTRELTSNDVSSLFASFLTAVSFQILVGIYAGFYASWLAVVIGYLSAVFLIRFLKTSRKLDLVVYGTSLVILLLSHAYTWTIFVIVFAIFLAVMLATHSFRRKSIVLLLSVTLFSVGIDVARVSLTGSISGIARDTEIAAQSTGSEQFTQRWNTLTETMYMYVGGQFSNFIILAFDVYWLFFSNLRKSANIFMIIFLSTGIIPLFAGNWHLQVRVLYNIPFQIPAAIALTYMNKGSHNFRVFLPASITWLVAMSITAVSNFYLIPPS